MVQSKIKNKMANSVDPDEKAHYEPHHLDLHCLQRHVYWLAEMKELNISCQISMSAMTVHAQMGDSV